MLHVDDSRALLEEILRFRAALAIQRELERVCAEHLSAPVADAKGLLPAAIFEGHQQAAKRAAAAAPSHEEVVCEASEARTWVHPIIDVRRRATVRRTSASATEATCNTCYRLRGVEYVKGDIVGVVEPLEESGQAKTTQSVSLKELCLATAEPLYSDALLPALEAIEPHHASKSLLDLWLNKLCGSADKMDSSFNQKRKKAWRLADEATYLFYVARKRLAEQLSFLSTSVDDAVASAAPCKLTVSLHTSSARLRQFSCLPPGASSFFSGTAVIVDVQWNTEAATANRLREWLLPESVSAEGSATAADGEVGWSNLDSGATTRLAIPITSDAILRLHQRYTEAAATVAPSLERSHAFLCSVARLLLRYHALSGGQMEKESGWQAAVPEQVIDVFDHYPVTSSSCCATPLSDGMAQSALAAAHAAVDVTFPPHIVTVECFASPLNATRRFFFSVFHDTDAAFGSLGNLFRCRDAQHCLDAVSDAAARAAAPAPHPTATLLRLECNPPFDHEVIAAAFTQLLAWLQTSSSSTTELLVSVLVIIPDSTKAHASEVRACAEQSPFCRWLRSIPASDCLYLHGAQQQQQEEPAVSVASATTAPTMAVALTSSPHKRKRARKDADDDNNNQRGHATRLIQLSCPTRVFVLQTEAAEKLSSGVAIGEEVARVWRLVSRPFVR